MKNTKLIHAVGNCINHCNYCADACLSEKNVNDMVQCIRLNRVCAEVCSTLSQVLCTDYNDVKDLVLYCIKVCNHCEEECSQHDYVHCQDCAEACRQCIAECEDYLKRA